MVFLSQALERVRAVVFGPRVWARRCRTTTSPATVTRSHRPSPDVRGARLVAVRGHRRKRHYPPEPVAWQPTDVLVRPYVACLGTGIYATAQGTAAGERLW